ncbi:TetR/AcrR family transcriptional regulator, partial [Listeria monocytogenes]|nr:TetR/AcrR family transcriptional regulator [Listeria monocytogenes]
MTIMYHKKESFMNNYVKVHQPLNV